jgi:hypothetical protein
MRKSSACIVTRYTGQGMATARDRWAWNSNTVCYRVFRADVVPRLRSAPINPSIHPFATRISAQRNEPQRTSHLASTPAIRLLGEHGSSSINPVLDIPMREVLIMLDSVLRYGEVDCHGEFILRASLGVYYPKLIRPCLRIDKALLAIVVPDSTRRPISMFLHRSMLRLLRQLVRCTLGGLPCRYLTLRATRRI